MFTDVNNFKKYENIPSRLIFGNIDALINPYISIVIPTYQRKDLLKYAIESALGQIESNVKYEIIIVDNNFGVTETLDLVKSFESNKILYYQNTQNIGMFGNLNRCIELARGEWVAFLHDDDMLNNRYIVNIQKLLKRKKNIGAIRSDFYIVKDNQTYQNSLNIKESIFRTIINGIGKEKLMRLTTADSQILGNVFGAPTCGNIFRKKFLIELGGFNEEYYPSSDWYFLHDYSNKFKFYKTNIKFGYYRIFNNESLNPSTIYKFVIQAEEFRQKVSYNSNLGRVLNYLFCNERYYLTFKWIKDFEVNNHYNFDDLSKKYGYTFRPIRQNLYFLIQRIYWYSKRVIALIIG